ncbi:DUF2690 domain-containing protein [Streptomyces sp. NPDC050161]|uniref:DUF2690 domain-containing protein n=1 Tax=Streptomyces sp. NPDC050161 TaxID=3365604 RepID=UPI0037947A84
MGTSADDPAQRRADDEPINATDHTTPDADGPGAPEGGGSLGHRTWTRIRAVGHWLRTHARHTLVVGVVTAVVGALAPIVLPPLFTDPPPACPGAGCDGKSPKGQCSADATTWTPTDGNPVKLHLRYSPACGAVWGRIINGEPGDMVTIQVTGGSSRSASIDYNHDKFTDMATVGKTFRVRLCAVPSTSPNRTGKWVRYCYWATEHSTWE